MTSLCPLAVSSLCQLMGAEGPLCAYPPPVIWVSPKTPCSLPAFSQAAWFLSRVGSQDARLGMPAMWGGRAGGCPPGARGSRRTLRSLPREHCGQQAEPSSGLEKLQQAGPTVQGASLQETLPASRGCSPHWTDGQTEAQRGQGESAAE